MRSERHGQHCHAEGCDKVHGARAEAVSANKKHGQGKETDTDGNTYEGEWKDGKMHGQGK